MKAVGLMQERPPVIRFLNEEVEDRDESIKRGYYVPKNVAFAEITPPGGRDSVKKSADELIKSWHEKGMSRQQPIEWYYQLKEKFDAWKAGNEIPEFGTPVLTFLGFSPEQRQALINANVRTIEDCAEMNEDTMARVGMGARELQNRAKLALSSANSLATEYQALLIKFQAQQEEIEQLRAELKALTIEKKGK